MMSVHFSRRLHKVYTCGLAVCGCMNDFVKGDRFIFFNLNIFLKSVIIFLICDFL